LRKKSEVSFRSEKVNPYGIKLSTAGRVNWTNAKLFRLTFAERIADCKVWTQQNAQRKFSLSDWLNPNQKRHCTFWIKFGLLSLKFDISKILSERLIQKVKSPIVYEVLFSDLGGAKYQGSISEISGAGVVTSNDRLLAACTT